MMHIISTFLDALFPQSAAVRQLTAETPESFVRFFAPERFHHTITLTRYAVPTVRNAIAANKFHHDTHAATLLRAIVSHWLTTLPPHPTILLPIPLGPARLRDRGHNQVTTILTDLPSFPSTTLLPDLLTRTRETAAQSKLDRIERFNNMTRAFAWNPRYTPTILESARVIIFDDVVTTGATLAAAREAILAVAPKSTELLCVGIAH